MQIATGSLSTASIPARHLLEQKTAELQRLYTQTQKP